MNTLNPNSVDDLNDNQINRLKDLLDENRVKYNSDFLDIDSSALVDQKRDFIPKLKKFVYKYVTNGYKRMDKKVITNLSNIAMDVYDSFDSKIINESIKKGDKIMSKDVNTVEKGLKKNALDQVRTTKKAFETYKKLSTNTTIQLNQLSLQAVEVALPELDKLEEMLENVVDDQSDEALKYNNEIVHSLDQLCGAFGQGTLGPANASNFVNSCLTSADSWKDITRIRNDKGIKKPEEINKINPKNPIYIIESYAVFNEELTIAENQLENYKKNTENITQCNVYKDRIVSHNQRVQELNEQKGDILKRYKNGLIDKATAVNEGKIVESQIKNEQLLLQRDQIEFNKRSTNKANREMLSSQVGSFLADIRAQETDLNRFASYAKYLKLNSLVALINGSATSEQIKNTIDSFQNIKNKADLEAAQLTEVTASFFNLEDQVQIGSLTDKLNEKPLTEEEQNDEFDKLFGSIDTDEKPKEQNEENSEVDFLNDLQG